MVLGIGPASRVNLHYTLDEHSACSMAYLILRTDMQAHESAAVSRKPANSDDRLQSIKHILFHFHPLYLTSYFYSLLQPGRLLPSFGCLLSGTF